MITDVKVMFWRSTLKMFRTPEAMVLSVAIPAILMLLFVRVFGGSMDVGYENFTNFIVPGILLNSLIQSSASTGIAVNQDVTKGMVQRFCTMDIAPASFIIGHVLAAVIKTLLTTVVILLVAGISGFRPSATLTGWLVAFGLILLFIFAITWFAIFLGVALKDAESAGGLMNLTAVLVFLSSGFAPTENMPRVLRYFAEHQPMTPFIDTLRALLNGEHIPGNDLLITLIWWVGILLVMCFFTIRVYGKSMVE